MERPTGGVVGTLSPEDTDAAIAAIPSTIRAAAEIIWTRFHAKFTGSGAPGPDEFGRRLRQWVASDPRTDPFLQPAMDAAQEILQAAPVPEMSHGG